MKKLMVLIALVALLVAPMLVSAHVAGDGGECDRICNEHGYDFGIANWKWDFQLEQFVLKAQMPDFDTNVVGVPTSLQWSSNPAAAALIVKDDGVVVVKEGGSEGQIDSEGRRGVTAVMFCGNFDNDVPEFGAFGLAMVGAAGLGILVFRKKF